MSEKEPQAADGDEVIYITDIHELGGAVYPPSIPVDELKPGQTSVINGVVYRSAFGMKQAKHAIEDGLELDKDIK